MTDTDPYLIVLNPIANEGHLDSWHVMFIAMLLAEGRRVIAVTPDAKQLRKKLALKNWIENESLIIIEDSPTEPSRAHQFRHLWQALKGFVDRERYCNLGPYRWTTMGRLRNVVASIVALTIKKMLFGLNAFRRSYVELRQPKQLESEAVAPIGLSPNLFCEAINSVFYLHPEKKISAVLNMYVDAYETEHQSWLQMAFNKPTPWIGVCITPSKKQIEGYYFAPTYRGSCFLDESALAAYTEQITNKKFVFLPDITEVGLPTNRSPFAQKVLNAAKCRKIVFLGGSVGRQKNLSNWLELVSIADSSEWFFLQVGRIHHTSLTAEDRSALGRVLGTQPENLCVLADYLVDERDFNEIISISDVIFAVYRDFSRSSNMLAKAAYFQKPILVAQGHLMDVRVTKYGIGQSVGQDSVPAMLQALYVLVKEKNLASNFAAYRHDFSPRVMQKKLVNFIDTCIND